MDGFEHLDDNKIHVLKKYFYQKILKKLCYNITKLDELGLKVKLLFLIWKQNGFI